VVVAVRHRHLVKLLGFVSCHDGSMLVYESTENGSLYDWLHGGDRKKRVLGSRSPGWPRASSISTTTACQGSCTGTSSPATCSSMATWSEAHLGDFGLAKAVAENRQAGFGMDCTESASCCFAGIYGYTAPGNLDQLLKSITVRTHFYSDNGSKFVLIILRLLHFCAECAYSLKATERSDVYSMGIVLITGLMPTDQTFSGDMDMVRWVQSGINAHDWSGTRCSTRLCSLSRLTRSRR
jgi:serine/threonine protein kinase